MKAYLKSIARQLKHLSLSLEKESILINKPWALIDEDFELQKLIFKKNKELILSKNGNVQLGKWDYFPEAKSLLIDRNSDKILCNEGFIDKGVMILKLDGTNNRFFVLANENEVKDLDAFKYLEEIRYKKLKIKEILLNDGRKLEIQHKSLQDPIKLGYPVTINAEDIEDGKYKLDEENKFYEIKYGKIFKILTENEYKISNGSEISIQQQDNWSISQGDYVYINGKPAGSLSIDFNKTKNLIVRHGEVVRLESKNPAIRKISKIWKEFWEA